MNTTLIGILALGVAASGLIVHAWRFRATRTLSFAALWVLVPLLGAMIAFLLTPPSLVTVSLGGASFALALLALAATVVVPVLVEQRTPEAAEPRRAARDRAA
jgi:zinc transporter ZupT